MKTPITNKRRGWAQARGGAEFSGRPLTQPSAAEARFERQLTILTEAMLQDAQRQLKALLRRPEAKEVISLDASFSGLLDRLLKKLQKKFDGVFGVKGLGMAETLAKGVDDHSRTNLHASLKEASGGLSLKTSVMKGRAEERMKAGIKANVSLIKSIPETYFQKIEGMVYRSMQSGSGMADLVKDIEALGESTHKRAKLIAQDQTSKATTALNTARMQDLGVTKFKWVHSHGGKEPRKLHLELDGQTFDLDNPPVIDGRTGERGYPGQLINCRCKMVPVFSFKAEAVE